MIYTRKMSLGPVVGGALLERSPHRERRRELLSHGKVVVVPHSPPENGLSLFDVREAARAENRFVRMDAGDLSDEDGVQSEIMVLKQVAL